ncbi:leucyl/phenylalanyl-tRNA--protein transferase [Psychromonas sp. RZ22]|nr:leucyl/phenylalanyl-tRNA--protein transferase [Psychromonas sp. RZ22]
MSKQLFALSNTDTYFPDPNKALNDPEGLLAIGGDLSSKRLINAYQQAIFPWFSKGEPILWWSPAERAVIQPEHVHISKSMSKFIRHTDLTITVNHDFSSVIEACSLPRQKQAETWISPAIKQAYKELHQLGYAHSIEVWNGELLVAGLYGVNVGGIFCGESMFQQQTNASKLAFIALCRHFSAHQGQLIDCQMMTPHLASMGVEANTREQFLTQLSLFKEASLDEHCWQQQILLLTP